MDYLSIRELFHTSDTRREKDRLIAQYEVFNKDFMEDLPYPVRNVLDDLFWRFRQEEWFGEAWEKYRQHVLEAGLGGNIKMPGYVFNPYLERYVDENPSKFNLDLNGNKTEAVSYSDMEISEFIAHSRTKGSKNGVRRYQNEDGTLTPLGKIHYREMYGSKKGSKSADKEGKDATEEFLKSFDNKSKIKKEVNRMKKEEQQHNKNVDDLVNSFKGKTLKEASNNKSKDTKQKDNASKDTKQKDNVSKDNKSKNIVKDEKKKDSEKDQEKKQLQKDINNLSGAKGILNATGDLTESINKAIPKGDSKKIYADYSHLTDQEIKKQIERIQDERKLSDLKGETEIIKSGREKAKDILSGVGAGIGVATSALTLLILFKKLRKDNMIEQSAEYIDATSGNFLEHHGVKGMKWGERRYQNEDGTLTPEGKARYRTTEGTKDILKQSPKYDRIVKKQKKEYYKYAVTSSTKKGAVSGMLIGGLAGAAGAALNGVNKGDFSKNGKRFVSRIITGAFGGALGGALGGGIVGNIAGRHSAKAQLADKGKEYTDELLYTPIDRIKKD